MELSELKLTKNDKLSNRLKCPKCFESDFWKTRDNRFKCKNCRHLFKAKTNPFNIPDQILNKIISEFLLEHSTNIILERVKVSKYKLLRILTVLRILMVKDLPEVFAKIIKSNEIYLPEIKNSTRKEFTSCVSQLKIKKGSFEKESGTKRKIFEYSEKEKTKTESKPSRRPVIGILCLEGKIFAKILPNIGTRDLKFLLKKKGRKKEAIIPANWGKYFGLIFKGRFYRLTPLGAKESRINVLEGFWGHLKRKLAAKGGIRKEKLPFYLGEYVWKYNHRKLSLKEQQELLLNLFQRNTPRSLG